MKSARARVSHVVVSVIGAAGLAPFAVAGDANPAFLRKLADPAHYQVDRAPAASESICGTNDLQEVNSYDGSLGQPQAFVKQHKFAVGALASGNLPTSDKYCTGTLVGPDLFITASHCVDDNSTHDYVAFNYEYAEGTRDDLPQEAFRIAQVVENGGSIDYAVLRLEGQPGLKYGWAMLRTTAPADGELITIVQHPSGEQKKVEIGHVLQSSGNYMEYGDLDTEPGSSGSGIVDSKGYLIGVHTNGGCTSSGGANSGVRLSAARSSTVLARLNNVALPVQDGAVVSLTYGQGGGASMLAGRDDGTVGLVPGGSARTSWRVEDLHDGSFRLVLDGVGAGSPRYLDGKVDGSEVRLAEEASDRDFGARWRLTRTDDGKVVLRTVGHGEGGRWLSAGSGADVGLGATAAAWTVAVVP